MRTLFQAYFSPHMQQLYSNNQMCHKNYPTREESKRRIRDTARRKEKRKEKERQKETDM